MAVVFCVYAMDVPVRRQPGVYWHDHPCCELICVTEGSGFHRTAEHQQPYRKGQVIIHHAGNAHADISSGPGLQFCIGIKGLAAEKLPSGVWECSAEAREIISKIHSVMNEPKSLDNALDMDILAGALAVQLRRDIASSGPAFEKEPVSDICEIARNEIEQHLESPYNLDQLCDKIFISKSYLRKLFREKYGESPLAYLIRKKLEIAEEHLRTTDMPVREIAARVGISNQFYFTSLFTKKKGISPSAYREKYKKSRKERESRAAFPVCSG